MVKKVFILVFAGLLLACSEQQTEVDSPYKVIIADASLVNKAVADFKGNVVLINFWATWCEPCVAEFPDLVMLGNKYRDQGLEVITISYDWEEQIESEVIPFLRKQKAEFTHFIQGASVVDQDFLLGIDPELKGGLPTTLLYDRNGKRQHIISGEFETDDLEKKIVRLLDKKLPQLFPAPYQ